MPRFFTKNIKDDKAIISGDDAKHIKNVLRSKAGDVIEICDCMGTDYICSIETLSKKEIVCKIKTSKPNDSEPKINVKLYQSLPKSSKMDLIIQKVVELGATEIQPFTSEYTVVKVNDKTNNKIERYEKISETASKQSGRGKIPKINKPMTFDEIIKESKNNDLNILAYEKEQDTSLKKVMETIKSKDGIKNIGIFIGSEGGFSENEIEIAKNSGMHIITLGNRILRTETASIILVNLIMYEFDN